MALVIMMISLSVSLLFSCTAWFFVGPDESVRIYVSMCTERTL